MLFVKIELAKYLLGDKEIKVNLDNQIWRAIPNHKMCNFFKELFKYRLECTVVSCFVKLIKFTGLEPINFFITNRHQYSYTKNI